MRFYQLPTGLTSLNRLCISSSAFSSTSIGFLSALTSLRSLSLGIWVRLLLYFCNHSLISFAHHESMLYHTSLDVLSLFTVWRGPIRVSILAMQAGPYRNGSPHGTAIRTVSPDAPHPHHVLPCHRRSSVQFCPALPAAFHWSTCFSYLVRISLPELKRTEAESCPLN